MIPHRSVGMNHLLVGILNLTPELIKRLRGQTFFTIGDIIDCKDIKDGFDSFFPKEVEEIMNSVVEAGMQRKECDAMWEVGRPGEYIIRECITLTR